jgi:hypothetical protein
MCALIINPYMSRVPNGLLNSLQAYYEFDESSGTALDSHSNALHLTDNNSDFTSSSTAKIGTSRVAPDSSNNLTRLENTNSSAFNPGSSQYTFALWFRPSVVDASYRPILAKRTDPNDKCYLLNYSNANARWATSDDGVNFATTQREDIFAVSTWYFITVGWDGTNQWFSLNNGNKESSAIGATFAGTANFRLSNNNGFEVAAGNYDLLGYWKKTLSATELSFLYNSGAGRSYSEFTT